MSVRPDADAERRTWSVEKVVPGGDGMARLSDGRIAFARGALPGDVIQPLAVEAKKGHVRATRWSLVTPSPERVALACPVAEACGGCDWMALERRAELVHKESLLREALERTGGFSKVVTSMTSAGPETHYRSRVRFHVDPSGQIGFFARGTHLLVEIPRCLVCRPEIDEALTALRRVPKDALGAFSEIDVRVADGTPKVALRLTPRVPHGAKPATKVVVSTCPRDWAVSVEGEPASPSAEQRYSLPHGAWLIAEPSGFTQVNWDVNLALVEAVVAEARARRVSRFLDAYAGSGNFTLPLLAAGMTGISVERDERAVDAARRAARAQGFAEAGFIVGDSAKVLVDLAKQAERFDLVLLDPPRSGARDALRSVVALAPPNVACCACDPVTLARDLRELVASGYRLDAVHGFDMFPSTHHVEALAWLTRS